MPHKFANLTEAIDKLEPELKDMFNAYETKEGTVFPNPVFGDLNYEQQVQLIHKHAVHHLKQFDLL